MSAQDPTQKNPTNIEDWSDDDSFKQLEESTSQKNDTDGFGEIFEFDDTKTSANDLDDILQDFEQIDLTSNQSAQQMTHFTWILDRTVLKKTAVLNKTLTRPMILRLPKILTHSKTIKPMQRSP